MYYTSIAYKSNNNIYIGQIDSSLNEIYSFKLLSNIHGKEFNENMLYIAMIAEVDASTKFYELKKIATGNFIGNVPFSDVPDDDKITICNKVLSDHLKSIILH